MDISRRKFIAMGVIILPWLAGGMFSLRFKKETFFDLLPTSHGTLQLGKIYLKSYPTEALDQTLIATLPDPSFHRIWLSKVQDQIRSDFDSENVVYLKGWLLSRTEARVAALAWLLKD